QDEGLHDEHELQAYFIQRIERFLNANGRQLIGWDEILEGGLSNTATVQSWRGMAGGKAAAEQGNFAIMSPTSHCYLDYGLDAIDLERIYHFDPVPEGLDPEQANYILGGECNMWTEHVPTKVALDAKVLPRMIGLAEALWSPEKDFNGFRHRLHHHYDWLRAQGFEFGFETVPIAFETQARPNGVNVHVTLADSGLRARFTTDASEPQPDSPLWQQDSTFSTNTTLKMSASLAGRTYPDVFELPVFVHSALQRPVTFQPEYSPYYTAGGDGALTDGIGGTLDFRDGHWQGYQGENLVTVVDLGEAREVREVFANFYQYNNAWIFAPRAMRVSTSMDGQLFETAGTGLPTSAPEDKGQFIERLGTSFAAHSARYVKLEAENIGTCPPWHDAAGSPAWLFIDEIRIE
ncbi:MAG: family 20 glycosylhydrolase, partial [Bacteroidota bacterium]